jgi:hypothetical protein
MKRLVCGILCQLSVAVLALFVLAPTVLAADTMADWQGLNNTQTGTGVFPDFDSSVLGADGQPGHDENFVVTSPTSIGGTVQAKINYNQDPNRGTDVNLPHVYLADQSLDGPELGFASTLHMDGTISFSTPVGVPVEPNICFCWYNSSNTSKRIGLGISNTNDPPNFTAQPDQLRIDLGYGASPANKFFNVSSDGHSGDGPNALLPNGTYHFTFDYTPGNPGDPSGGNMSATVSDATHNYTYSNIVTNDPWNNDFNPLDRFGIVIRSTGSTTFQGDYQLSFSNVTYTGGTLVAGVQGDYNGNGVVDMADYVLWRNGGPLQNEVNTVGTVDATDYDAWRARFGNTSGSGSGLGAGAVPEPATALLMVFAGLATVASWRGRC